MDDKQLPDDDFLTYAFPPATFDLITIIGSTIGEMGKHREALLKNELLA